MKYIKSYDHSDEDVVSFYGKSFVDYSILVEFGLQYIIDQRKEKNLKYSKILFYCDEFEKAFKNNNIDLIVHIAGIEVNIKTKAGYYNGIIDYNLLNDLGCYYFINKIKSKLDKMS